MVTGIGQKVLRSLAAAARNSTHFVPDGERNVFLGKSSVEVHCRDEPPTDRIMRCCVCHHLASASAAMKVRVWQHPLQEKSLAEVRLARQSSALLNPVPNTRPHVGRSGGAVFAIFHL